MNRPLLKPGDYVQELPDGPVMAVARIIAAKATCTWWDKDKGPQRKDFACDNLGLVFSQTINGAPTGKTDADGNPIAGIAQSVWLILPDGQLEFKGTKIWSEIPGTWRFPQVPNDPGEYPTPYNDGWKFPIPHDVGAM